MAAPRTGNRGRSISKDGSKEIEPYPIKPPGIEEIRRLIKATQVKDPADQAEAHARGVQKAKQAAAETLMPTPVMKAIASADKRLDHLLVELLDKGDGIFVGENHEAPVLSQSLGKLLPLLKAHGVETLSVEITQDRVDAMKKAKSYGDYLKVPLEPRNILANERLYNLVKQAHGLGLRVLGHESARIPDGPSQAHDDAVRKACSPEGMDARNEYAAQYIKAHKTGKVLVLGGLAHSGRYTRKEAEAVGDDGFHLAPIMADYIGLDAKLGYPSVDYVMDYNEKHYGLTKHMDGKFCDYIACLPSFIYTKDNYKTFSAKWPKPLPESLGNLPSPLPQAITPMLPGRKR